MITFWRRNFMWAEPVLVVLLTIAFVLWVERFGGLARLIRVLDGNRSEIYGALASVFGALLGFVLTAVSIVLGFSSMDQLAIVRESPHYHTLYRIYIQATWLLAIATLFALVGLVLDRDDEPIRFILYASALASGLAAIRIARCVWALEQVVLLVVRRPRGR
ncbi:MAG TPA: hypothetical protein VLT84_10715 [Acidobacteriota bacterium]|nr:hypothetical protein [Acidobacteriota bacterium]